MYCNMEQENAKEKREKHCHMKWLVMLVKIVETIINLVRDNKKSNKTTKL